MKLVITVTDEETAETTKVEAVQDKVERLSTNGHAPIETFDGGPVPEVLLSMESEVAAGHRRAPGQSS